MNVTIESLLEDAKQLVKHLKNHDTAADALTEQTTALKEELESHNVYQENLSDSKMMANVRSEYLPVLTGMQQENCAINTLRKENMELQNTLLDYQNVLELIMTKYRHNMLRFVKRNDWYGQHLNDIQAMSESGLVQEQVECMNDKITEMAAVMQSVIKLDEESSNSDQKERIEKLRKENDVFRKMLLISRTQDLSDIVSGDDHSDSTDEATTCKEEAENKQNINNENVIEIQEDTNSEITKEIIIDESSDQH